MEHLITIIKTSLETNILAAFFIAYLGGVLTTFTPCVYPMIPVTLAITLGTEAIDASDKWKKLVNPFFYCLGIAVTYALMGMLAATTGTFFGALAGNPWLYLMLGMVFALLALSSLGMVRLPTLQFHYRADRSNRISLFLFGALSAAVLSPCTAPMLGLLLVYASTKNIFTGALLLFAYAGGFSSLLLVMAAASLFAKDKLPRSGAWMNAVKYGVTLLAVVMALFFFWNAWVLLTRPLGFF